TLPGRGEGGWCAASRAPSVSCGQRRRGSFGLLPAVDLAGELQALGLLLDVGVPEKLAEDAPVQFLRYLRLQTASGDRETVPGEMELPFGADEVVEEELGRVRVGAALDHGDRDGRVGHPLLGDNALHGQALEILQFREVEGDRDRE